MSMTILGVGLKSPCGRLIQQFTCATSHNQGIRERQIGPVEGKVTPSPRLQGQWSACNRSKEYDGVGLIDLVVTVLKIVKYNRRNSKSG